MVGHSRLSTTNYLSLSFDTTYGLCDNDNLDKIARYLYYDVMLLINK